MNIILIGMRGSGKSIVGKLLAKKTQRQFFDLDKMLIKQVGISISELVTQYGWDYFRDKESDIAEEVAHQTNTVISTGGGIILRKKNIEALGENGKFIFLRTSVETIIKRIGDDKNRPALTNKKNLREELETVWHERKTLYEQIANVTINTDTKTPEELVGEITKQL